MIKVLRICATVALISLLLIPSLTNAAQFLRVHRVEQGENLHSIAQRYGTTIQQIKEHNSFIKNPNNLFPDQALIVPEVPVIDEVTEEETTPLTVYVVEPGDTLFLISQKTGIPMAVIAAANSLADLNNILVGQELSLVGRSDGEAVPLQPQPEPNFKQSTAQLARLYPDTFFLRGPADSRKVALTFDDGPHPRYTAQVLDVLKEHGVPATFFVVGGQVERHPELLQRMLAEGHLIGNHTWNHPDMRRLSPEEIRKETLSTEEAIYRAVGLRPATLRPPYGGVSSLVIEELRELDYRVINWSVDSVDWRDQDVDKILVNTLPGVRPGAILLFHDAGGNQTRAATVAALPELIYTLQMNGYEFVTVDELLSIPGYK